MGGSRLDRAAETLASRGLDDPRPTLYVCQALDYLVRAAATRDVSTPWPLPSPPSAQWVLDAAAVEPDIALTRSEIVTIGDGDEDDEPGDLGDFIKPLTMDAVW